jgi:ABC-2 type transport system ATP-binding protein
VSWGVADVTVRFGDRVALDGVSLDAPAGQVTAVVGGDGAGKTTLLRAFAGALAVTGGEVRRPAATGIGYLSSSSGTYPDLSVDENIQFAAAAYGLSAAEIRERSARYLERSGLAPFRDRLAGHLSGGMRQKLGVIRALLHQPELVVLDEPTTGVDPVSRADLWWMMAYAATAGAAVVFATTYLDEAERAARLLVLDDGQELAAGTADEIVAAMPGAVRSHASRPPDPVVAAGHAWRRGARWRSWSPSPSPAAGAGGDGADADAGGDAVEPDLQDAVIVLALAREPARTGSAP